MKFNENIANLLRSELAEILETDLLIDSRLDPAKDGEEAEGEEEDEEAEEEEGIQTIEGVEEAMVGE